MQQMKKVYIARFKHGLMGTCKVFAWDEDDARRAAFSAYTYNSYPRNPNPKIEDVVESVELDPDQLMDSQLGMPSTQCECRSLLGGGIRRPAPEGADA